LRFQAREERGPRMHGVKPVLRQRERAGSGRGPGVDHAHLHQVEPLVRSSGPAAGFVHGEVDTRQVHKSGEVREWLEETYPAIEQLAARGEEVHIVCHDVAAKVNRYRQATQRASHDADRSHQAHPADETGKHHLQQVYRRAIDPAFGGRIAFVDDYDLHVAHFLVQGCDVWLNNPRKPMEASGTSGMKASLNGVPHFSIGDGWWAEGYTGENGWLINAAETGDQQEQDAADAARIYEILETEIVPTFYDRENGIPRAWLRVVRNAIATVAARFSARRMVKEYVDTMYAPAIHSRERAAR